MNELKVNRHLHNKITFTMELPISKEGGGGAAEFSSKKKGVQPLLYWK